MKILALLLATAAVALGSLLDQDPEVVYTEEFVEDGIKLLVVKPLRVFATKEGKGSRGRLKVNTKVELVGFNERAYQIRGTRSNGEGVSGWVSPKALAAKDPKFVEKFQQIYKRQLVVREMIENHEIAIGMTPEEVGKSLGEPTKTKVRRTAKGSNETWEFIEYEEVKHYATVRNPYTGGLVRQLVSTTKEEKSKTKVEFESGVATAIEESEDRTRGRVKSVAFPVVVAW